MGSTQPSVKRLGGILLAAMMAIGGCGMSNAVTGSPVPVTGRVTTHSRATSVPIVPSSTIAPSSTMEQSSSQPPTTTSSADPTALDEPAAVVQAYFDAINTHDYQRAWTLGGKNIGQSYTTFATGFATTDHDLLTIQSTQGDTVTADLTAVQTDGTKRTFHGTYTVANGTITHFSVRPTG
jgi:hypothetical protein